MRYISVIMIVAILAGCGSPPDTPATVITGKAARAAVVYLKDGLGHEVTTNTSPDGIYVLNTNGLQKPMILKAVYSNASTHFAVSGGNTGTVNIDSLSTGLLSIAVVGVNLLELYLTIKIEVLTLIVKVVDALKAAL